MRIAIVGSGVAGLLTAHRLRGEHEISVFESCDRVGGNVRTIPVRVNGECYEMDVGASLFHPKTYPMFFRLLDELGIRTRFADLSYVVVDRESRSAYRGTYQRIVFGRPLSFLLPSKLWLARDAWRFYRDGRRLLQGDDGYDLRLEELLANRYSRKFITRVLFPIVMVAWGAEPQRVSQLSARCVAEYLLRIRPGWGTICGGTQEYLRRLAEPIRDKIRLLTPVRSIRRGADHVEVASEAGTERFDSVVIATHGDQALRLLEDPTDDEREVLSAFTYQSIIAAVHRDPAVVRNLTRSPLPSICICGDDRPCSKGLTPPSRLDVTFHLNRLMDSDCPEPLFASILPMDGIAQDKILSTLEYRQPIFTPDAVHAQGQWQRINGVRGTFYCGAYWGFGEHEDAVHSASAVCQSIRERAGSSS